MLGDVTMIAPCNGTRSRGGWSAVETSFVIVGLAVLIAIASFAFIHYQERAHVKLCFTQQRNLQGLIENLSAPELDVSIDELYVQLIRAGLLPGVVVNDFTVDTVQLNDPGGGPASFRNYLLMPGSRMVGCVNHGSLFADDPF